MRQGDDTKYLALIIREHPIRLLTISNRHPVQHQPIVVDEVVADIRPRPRRSIEILLLPSNIIQTRRGSHEQTRRDPIHVLFVRGFQPEETAVGRLPVAFGLLGEVLVVSGCAGDLLL